MRRVVPFVVAVLAVLPLIVTDVWGGFRLGLSDPVLSVISTGEQPLSVRSPGGIWAIGLTLLWCGLAYRQRRVTAWETALVLVGGTAALLRLGNAWLDALLLVPPLAWQFRLANVKPWLLAGLGAASLATVVLTAEAARPPALPAAAVQALLAVPTRGTVLADWRWAPSVQHQLGPTRDVRASAGLASEPPDFWLRYLQVAQGHASWSADLRQLNVNLVVLDSTDQQRAAAELVRASPDWQVVFDASGATIAERIQQ